LLDGAGRDVPAPLPFIDLFDDLTAALEDADEDDAHLPF
jgi:hypothetical protein